jgi:hypothetical protein
MTQFTHTIWQKWSRKYAERIVNRHLQKQAAILQNGLQIYADVQDCYVTRYSLTTHRLVRLRILIPLKDRLALEAVSSAFVACDAKQLIGKRLLIRFLPGDLSHVVIMV